MLEYALAESIIGREVGTGVPLLGVDIRNVRSEHAPDGLVALTSRQGLWFARLSGTDAPSTFSRAAYKESTGKWPDLGPLAWCPDSARPGWLGAIQQRSVVLWDAVKDQVCGNLESGGVQHRSLTDMDWGALLATGSMDGSVCLHDPRDLRKFAAVFNTHTPGHTQVRCNRLNTALVASAHMGTVYVWDLRGGRKPLATVLAHVSNKIGALDWNPVVQDEFATCSPSENEVKRWSVESPLAEKNIVQCSSGASWVRYSPQGNCLVTAHADSKVRVTSLAGSPAGAEILVEIPSGGPVGKRIDLARFSGPAPPDAPLSWSLVLIGGARDLTLRQWKLVSEDRDEQQRAVPLSGREAEDEVAHDLSLLKLLGDRHEGFAENNIYITWLTLDELDVRYGSVQSPVIHLRVLLPPQRSRRAPRILHILAPSGHHCQTLRTRIKKKFEGEADSLSTRIFALQELHLSCNGLMLELSSDSDSDSEQLAEEEQQAFLALDDASNNSIASQHHRGKAGYGPDSIAGRQCVGSNLRKFLGPMHPLHQLMWLQHTASGAPTRDGSEEGGGKPDELAKERDLSLFGPGHAVPQPRTSGAVFSPTGVLWVFGKAAIVPVTSPSLRPMGGLPGVGGTTGKKSESPLLAPRAFLPGQLPGVGERSAAQIVVAAHRSPLVLPVDMQLAAHLRVAPANNSKQFLGSCRHNATVAARAGRVDLDQTWRLAAHAFVGASGRAEWMSHPLGAPLLARLLLHHARQGDVQTVAVLVAVFNRAAFADATVRGRDSTLHDLVTSLVGDLMNTNQHVDRSFGVEWVVWATRCYFEMLFAWKFHGARTELLQSLSDIVPSGAGGSSETWTEAGVRAASQPMRLFGRAGVRKGSQHSHKVSVVCSVCRIPVQGLAASCGKCGHGGHVAHMRPWFSKYSKCATGCGCHCYLEGGLDL